MLLVGVLFAAMSCTPGAPSAHESPTPSLVAYGGSVVNPPAGEFATVGWDGVDQSVMLVSPVFNPDLHQTGLAVWLLTVGGWRPMPNSGVATDETGFEAATLAYDSDRRLELLIATARSRANGTEQTTVSQWDGKSWQLVTSTTPLVGALLSGAYSPDLHALVGVSGSMQSGYKTALFDASGWRLPSSGRTPFGLPVAVAYDARSHVILALDGTYRTWKFDGTAWVTQDLNPPTPLGLGLVTFDSQRGDWIFFGGSTYIGGGLQQRTETWIGDGISWKQLTPKSFPPARVAYREFGQAPIQMAWDPVRRRAVLFGGIFGYCCDVVYKDTWAWDGNTWHKLLDTPPLATPDQIPSPPPCTASTSYGLLIVQGSLQVLDTCGKVAASTPIALSSVTNCVAGGPPAFRPPPVSASDHTVYFRDGDTKIRSIGLDGSTSDVTTVPGGPTTISFFSVRPDDQRIAVVVEDLSAADTIAVKLYVEDLVGHGHHADIYSTSLAKSTGTTLWPVGWHANSLLLAVVPACGVFFSNVSPSEWHVVDPVTGNRLETIAAVDVNGVTCWFGRWPSPAGFTCTGGYEVTTTLDWRGAQTRYIGIGISQLPGMLSALSPDGRRLFVSSDQYGFCTNGVPHGGTCVVADVTKDSAVNNGFAVSALAAGRLGCLWIDNDHVLAPDAVIEMPPPQFPKSAYLPVIPLASPGACAGRFPGGLG